MSQDPTEAQVDTYPMVSQSVQSRTRSTVVIGPRGYITMFFVNDEFCRDVGGWAWGSLRWRHSELGNNFLEFSLRETTKGCIGREGVGPWGGDQCKNDKLEELSH